MNNMIEQQKILIAGATGYLGQYLVKEAKKQGYRVRALSRSPKKLAHLEECIDDLHVGEVTKPESIAGICEKVDFVISTVGITRQKDGLTYMDVDYRGNKNLLDDAVKCGVAKFVYVSGLNAHLMPELKIIQAKEKFVRELKESGIDYTVMRPNGFFSDMLEFLKMARKGKINLFGSGEYRINPIHGEDLAKVCLSAFSTDEKEIEVGGPDILTHNHIAELAFECAGRQPRIRYTPLWQMKLLMRFMRMFASSKTYGPIEFIMSALSRDMVAPPFGEQNLREFYRRAVAGWDAKETDVNNENRG